ncbi:SDR family oxidoreductase [Quadrisphaera sp. DSM 44207]|uniref:SDR family oxidoreductase n=1 Tax=Quadrisphaera sp. DSM 44207 TaxID=1881057 RepID=UPI00088A5313|nr:SDR family oxidoreductase [Quadrisphaera sp. DSM 44207]SDQ85341.1 Enoyl-(Acyl carrier protein) reductase [Quadrisphaera sp. DSM 44207]
MAAASGSAAALVAGPDDALARALVQRLGAGGARVRTLAEDGDPAAALADPGGVRVLVVRVGLLPGGRFPDADPAAWFEAVDAELLRLHRLVRAALPGLRACGDGRVVVLGAGWDAADLPRSTAAGALHGGVVAYVKTLARELGRDGTCVNEVVIPPDAEAVGVDDVADAVALLAGPHGGAVTGQLLRCGRGGDLRP